MEITFNKTILKSLKTEQAGKTNQNVETDPSDKNVEATSVNDEKDVTYEVADDIDNKAKQEVSGAEDSGANLKGILRNLISKCSTYGTSMAELSEEFDGYIDAFNEASNKLDTVGKDIKALVSKYGDDLENIKAQIEEKQTELEAKQAEYKALLDKEDNTPETRDKKMALEQEINSLGESLTELQNLYNYKSTEGKSQVEKNQAIVEQTGNSVSDLRAKITTANKEIEVAEQYSEETIEQGTKATEINSRKEARKAGFKGIFKRGVKKAHHMGNQAINVGKELHTSTTQNASKSANISESQDVHAQMTTKFMNMAEEAGYTFTDNYLMHSTDNTIKENTKDSLAKKGKSLLPEEEDA